jgi:ELWxxDGT repeat protein
MRQVGGRLLFSAFSPATGRELWSSDGTEAGTVAIEIAPGAESSSPAMLYASDPHGAAIFAAYAPDSGVEAWVTDGTALGTRRVTDLAPGAAHSNPRGFIRAGGRIYFSAADATNGPALWSLPASVLSRNIAYLPLVAR